MSRARTSRRRFLKLVAGSSLASQAFASRASRASPASGAEATLPGIEQSRPTASIGDGALRLEFDASLRSRAWHLRTARRKVQSQIPLTAWAATDYLVLEDGSRVEQFVLERSARSALHGRHGRGAQLTLSGIAVATGSSGGQPRTPALQIEKRVTVALYERYPGFAFYRVSYRNLGDRAVPLKGWRTADLVLLPADSTEPAFWSFCGSTHADRRDWVQPVGARFSQENFMGMSASDYGGGTPVVDVWRRDCGIAVGHLDVVPRLLSLPVMRVPEGAQLALGGSLERTWEPGEELVTPESFIATHAGDYFATLDTYRRVMAERGLVSPQPPAAAYEGIWCAWGYERECTVQLIEETLPKARALGLGWAVVDDGWQSNVGDWQPHPAKFPRGAADMRQMVEVIRAQSMRPRLWVTPIAASPGSDLLHDHTDMLLLDRDGAPQLISWWNSFYLCPAYAPTVAYSESLVRRFIGEWGFAGLKIDGQHLNGVAPCYNPAHHHARPEESVERLQDLLHTMYLAAVGIDRQAVMEICPCGTCYSFFNFASMNQAPASDPESSWQVRHKGKTLKALMGRSAAFAGDHVELSDGGDDFASTVGVGAIVSTKFTWPKDPKPKDSFLLTPQREELWRRWIALYNELRLPQGTYRGELYDVGFDKPETHVVEKSGRLYYACYSPGWSGPVELRGLVPGRYRLRDYFNQRELGEVVSPGARLHVAFEHFLVMEAIPA